MAGGKQTPRQKMIGLMYLVFISLMALNVSVTVMDSFVLIDEGIKQTNVNFNKRVEDVYVEFRKQMAIVPERTGPYYQRAEKVEKLADSLINFILHSRADMISSLDGITLEQADTLNLMHFKTKALYSSSSRYWLIVGNQDPISIGGRGSRAHTLRTMIEDFKENVTGLIPEEARAGLELGLDTDGPFYDMGGNEVSWQRAMFDRVIPIAIATNLSRLVTEVRNAEFEAVNRLFAAITAEDFTFDKIEARVVPRSEIVIQGDYYEADIFVAAYDTRQNPTIIVDGRQIDVRDGIGKLRLPANVIGARTIRGEIKVPNPATGLVMDYPFQANYVVERPSVIVSADQMNVFYRGLANPISISVPSVASENIRANISRGRLVPRGAGRWDVMIDEDVRNVRINVSVLVDGAVRPVDAAEFRVFPVPPPVARVAGLSSGDDGPRGRLLAAPRVTAELDGFLFDVPFDVVSYEVVTRDRGGDITRYNVRGSGFSPELRSAIENARRNQVFEFRNIIARGPEGERPIPAVLITVQ